MTLTVPNVKGDRLISTHTLTWSVTACSVAACYARYISTHTLTWRVTNSSMWSRQTFDISTHTLTWSVTDCADKWERVRNFNSHAHVERDISTHILAF